MDTPICNFVQKYARSNKLRLHMPGHKGADFLGMEHLDITEIDGADSLYEADGIIAGSEANASSLFGCRTFYSTEGSSQCIRAMLYLVLLYSVRQGRKPLIAAGRNAHKALLSAVTLLDVDVHWLLPGANVSYLSCDLTPTELDGYLKNTQEKPAAVYLTSPDYLGHMADIKSLAEVCHRYDVLLIVDNAHGAYLKFLAQPQHPIELGADICCDSAHKTLPVLTGGAYLHLSADMDVFFGEQVKCALMLFGSTSPSYLILQSLDAANMYLETYPQRLADFIPQVELLKERLRRHGYSLYGQEPLKITIEAKPYGYTGVQLAELLREQNIEAEFADRDYTVLMLTPEIEVNGLQRLEQALLYVLPKVPIEEACPVFLKGERVLSAREAMLSDSETLPVKECLGRVLAVPTIGCPPAVPILVCGERINEQALACFEYYGIKNCCVVKKK